MENVRVLIAMLEILFWDGFKLMLFVILRGFRIAYTILS